MARQPLRTYRATDEVYQAAQEAAAVNGQSVSEVIVAHLIDYTQANRPKVVRARRRARRGRTE